MSFYVNQLCLMMSPCLNGPDGVLDSFVANGVTGIALNRYTAAQQQYWFIQPSQSGTYHISTWDQNLLLDCNTNDDLWLGARSGATTQDWYFDDLGNGKYGIRNRATGKTLWANPDSWDIHLVSGSPADDYRQQWVTVLSYPQSIILNQNFVLARKSEPNQSVKILQNASNADLSMAPYNGSGGQMWWLQAVDHGFVNVVNAASGRFLDGDPQGNIHANSANSVNSSSATYQQWFFEDWKNGYYCIRNRATGLFIYADNSGRVSVRNLDSTAGQFWAIDQSQVSMDLGALGRLYTNGWNATIDNGANCAEYSASDANFRTKQPAWSADAHGGGTAVMLIDHIRGGALEQDDHATLTVTFLPTGQVYAASLEWTLGSSWAIEWGTKAIVKIEDVIDNQASNLAGDAAVEIADLLSAGALAPLDPVINKIASDMASKLISSLFSNLNAMLKKELGHDDGGRQTFIATINHNMNKLCNSMAINPPLVLPNTSISFDVSSFPNELYNILLAAYGSNIIDSHITWDGNHTTNYRAESHYLNEVTYPELVTWKPDWSACPFKEGLYISTKIDYLHGSAAKDGHYVVMIGVSSNGQLNSAQASLVFPPDQNLASYLSPLFTGTDADAQLKADLTANRPGFAVPDSVDKNIQAMLRCIVTSGG